MPNPSLLIVPARFKTGRLYSQIPSNTDNRGDFNVTRATAATRVNSAGLIESVASGIPRLDYFASGGVVGCPALLVEPSGSNLALQSAGFEVSGTWVPSNTSITTGTTAAFTAPDGTTDADLLTSTSASSCNIAQYMTIASGTYTISVFGKAGTSHILSLGNISRNTKGAWFNLNAGAVTGTVNGGTASMQNYGNGWYRCIYTSSGIVSGTGTLIVSLSDAANGTTATSGTNLYVWGAQLETGSVATSYIPTTTAAITRNADVVSVSGAVSGSIGQTEGTIYAEVDVRNWTASGRVFAISNGTSDARVMIQVGANRTLQAVVTAASGEVTNIATASGQVNGIYKCAVAYASGDFAFYVNGNQVGTDSSGAVPACNNVALGKIETSASTNFLNDRIRAAALYTTRLTNDQLAALTSP